MKGKAADALSGVRKKASVIGLPFIVIFLGIYVMPMAASLLYSMQDNRFSKSFVGIKNYLNIWQNRLFLHALSNTFIISLFCVIASMLTAVLICFCFECKGIKANSVLALLVLPMMLPSIAVTTIWKAVFQTSSFTGRQEGIFALTLLFLWKYSGTAYPGRDQGGSSDRWSWCCPYLSADFHSNHKNAYIPGISRFADVCAAALQGKLSAVW